MKLGLVQIYQKVDFERTIQGYFTEVRSPNQAELDMSFADGLVHIKSDTDYIIIPVSNVAIMKPSKSSDEAVQKDKKKK